MAFGNQFAKVVEWQEYGNDTIFWKWHNNEIKKGSRLVIRPGQDAIFMYNGVIEGVFKDEGSYDIASDIIPFLSTLKGFKFGFNSGIRAEVLFINTKEFTVKWGTKNAINIPTQSLPGGMPIRSFGTFNCKVDDYQTLIDKVAGIQDQFEIEDVKERVLSKLDQLLMKWIVSEGKDLFNLQLNADEISRGICADLDMDMRKIGIAITNFVIASFTYPESIQKMAEKVASQSMIGDMNRFQQAAMGEAMINGDGAAGSTAASMAGIGAGMAMAQQFMNNGAGVATGAPAASAQVANQAGVQPSGVAIPNFCPNCGSKTTGGNFCSNCGQKLV